MSASKKDIFDIVLDKELKDEASELLRTFLNLDAVGRMMLTTSAKTLELHQRMTAH